MMRCRHRCGTPLTLYTVPSSTTTIILGLMLCNVDTSQRLVDVHIESDTSDTETNSNVHAIKDAPIPAELQHLKSWQEIKSYYKQQMF